MQQAVSIPEPSETNSANPEIGTAEFEAADKPGVKFIFWHHTSEFVPSIIPHLKGADIIAYENFTDGSATARQIDKGLGAISRDEATSPRFDYLREFNTRLNNGMFECLCEIAQALSLSGGGKSFVTIDAYRSGALQDLNIKYMDKLMGSQNYLAAFGSPIVAEQHILDYSKDLADLTMTRDSVMAANLDKLVAQQPGKRIAVTVGAAHTRIARMLNVDVPIKKVYVTFNPLARAALAFLAVDSIPRYLIFNRQPPTSMMHKAVLQRLIVARLGKSPIDASLYGVDRFSDQEAERFIDQLERAHETIGKDPKATFRYDNAVTQAAKLAVKKLAL
jgi:hypothetical protein